MHYTMEYKYFKVAIENNIAQVAFNRPKKANALDMASWKEMQFIFETLSITTEVRVVVLSGEGKHFCSGIDLELLMSLKGFMDISCAGRKSEKVRELVQVLQNTVIAIEKCKKPILAAIHKGCIGGGVDIISACDMRYCTDDAFFTIKEIDLGMVADVGTLQRLPKILSPGIVAEMAYTGRNVSGKEAKEIGLTNHTYPSKENMMEEVLKIATLIASKSPLSIRGTKEMLLYSRDHSVNDSLNYMTTWNAAMLLSDDLMEAFSATIEKRRAEFED